MECHYGINKISSYQLTSVIDQKHHFNILKYNCNCEDKQYSVSYTNKETSKIIIQLADSLLQHHEKNEDNPECLYLKYIQLSVVQFQCIGLHQDI